MSTVSKESRAADEMMAAEKAMTSAAASLYEVGSAEAAIHAAELIGAMQKRVRRHRGVGDDSGGGKAMTSVKIKAADKWFSLCIRERANWTRERCGTKCPDDKRSY